MPTVIAPVVTDAGFDAAVNLSGNGLHLDITHVAISGTDKFTPNAASTIPHRSEKAPIAGSIKTGTDSFLVSVYMPSYSGAAYNVTAIGFYAGDPDAGGVLVAVYSHPTATIFQRNSLDWVGQFALKLTRVPNDSVGVVVDPQASIAIGLLNQHVSSADPHPQYLTIQELAAFNFSTLREASNFQTQQGLLSDVAVTPNGLAATMLGGVGQSLVDVKLDRTLGGTFWNFTGRPILVYVSVQTTSDTTNLTAYKNGAVLMQQGSSFAGIGLSMTILVKHGENYGFGGVNVFVTLWKEER